MMSGCATRAHDLFCDDHELDLIEVAQNASGKRACLVGAVGAAASCAARASRVVWTTLGVMSTNAFLGSRSHHTICAVIKMARTAHNLVVANMKSRVGSIGVDDASGKRACLVGAVGATACLF